MHISRTLLLTFINCCFFQPIIKILWHVYKRRVCFLLAGLISQQAISLNPSLTILAQVGYICLHLWPGHYYIAKQWAWVKAKHECPARLKSTMLQNLPTISSRIFFINVLSLELFLWVLIILKWCLTFKGHSASNIKKEFWPPHRFNKVWCLQCTPCISILVGSWFIATNIINILEKSVHLKL